MTTPRSHARHVAPLLLLCGAALPITGCVDSFDDPPIDDNGLSSASQEVAVAPWDVVRPYGFAAMIDSSGFDRGNLSIPVVIVESSRKQMKFPLKLPTGGVIWIDIWDSTLNHDSAFYQQLVFGGADRNAADYFAEESHNHLTLTSAGRSNRLDLRDAPTASGDFARTLKVRAGDPALGNFDFKKFDKNGDGTVDNTELWILHVDGGSTTGNHNGGSNRNSSPACPVVTTRTGTVKVCSTIINVGDTVGFETLVHELSHVLGTHDLYGRWNQDSNFSGATVMGATIFATPDDRRTVYHDAWHRFQLGWERPAHYDLTSRAEASGSHFLLPPGSWTGFGNAIIFGGISSSRYLMVEYRRAQGYDQNVRGEGLYVWSVEQDADKDLAVDTGYRNYRTLYLGPEICVDGRRANDNPGLSGCKTIGDWDTVVPVDGSWRQFYLPNSRINPRVRAVRSGDGVRVEWQSMECDNTADGGTSCHPYNP